MWSYHGILILKSFVFKIEKLPPIEDSLGEHLEVSAFSQNTFGSSNILSGQEAEALGFIRKHLD